MDKLVKLLKEKNKTISSMESCTGGLFASEITNSDGSSIVFKIGLVTYSNEYKEYFGVSKKTIDEYTVYSKEVAREMAKNSCRIANSDYAIGITGLLGKKDPNNESIDTDSVYVCIYTKEENEFYDYKLTAIGNTRQEKKLYIVNYIKEKLYEICK